MAKPIIDLTKDEDDDRPRATPESAIIIDDDQEDEDLKLAIAMSLQEHHTNQLVKSKQTIIKPPTSTSDHQLNPEAEPPKAINGSIGLAGLDRKQMEAERLARLKRKRNTEDDHESSTSKNSISPPPLRRQRPQNTADTTTPETKLPSRPLSKSNRETQFASLPAPTSTPPSYPSNTLQYPLGKILLTTLDQTRIFTKTNDFTSPSKKDAISLPTLLHSPHPTLPLKSVLLSTFIASFDWLLPHFNTKTINFLLILHAANAQHKSLLTSDFAGIPNVRLVFPNMEGIVNCMHSKLMVLFFEEEKKNKKDEGSDNITSRAGVCRIVVPTANLTPVDWGVDGVMENAVFVIDLPSMKGSMNLNNRNNNEKQGVMTGKETDDEVLFKRNLIQLLRAQDVPEDAISKLDRFDFANTLNLGFVHSMGGSHSLAAGTDPQQKKGNTGINTFFKPKDNNNNSSRRQEDTKTSLSPSSTTQPTPSPLHSTGVRTGLHCLSDTIKTLGLSIPAGEPLPRLDYITSSVGNLKISFLQHLFLAVCGRAVDTPIPNTTTTTTTTSKSKPIAKHINPSSSSSLLSSSQQQNQQTDIPNETEMAKNLRIYFPSETTVRSSKGGPATAGTICFQSKWWESANDILKTSLRDCVGVREDRVLMHSKILYVRFSQPLLMQPATPSRLHEDLNLIDKVETDIGDHLKSSLGVDSREYVGWVYVGSANLSESAWGQLVIDSRTKHPKVNSRNWESGVVVPIPLSPLVAKILQSGALLCDISLRDVFGDHVPVPFREPADTYEDGRQPWFFMK